ncbi:unnamed protein product [Symbiodinium sp. CCMP2456]|nr:unnamed protein product [Symbiodinium sp. CCMP2456]
MSSPSKPHAHGEHTANKGTASNAVEALPSMSHAHEKHCRSCDGGHLVKLQKFLAAVDQNPKRLEKMISARRKYDGISTPDSATSRDTSTGEFLLGDDWAADQPTPATQHVCKNRACNRRTVSL